MKPIRLAAAGLAAAVLAATGAATGIASAEVLTIATNPQGSLGYRTGIAVAKVLTGKSDLTARTQPMAGSTTYIPMMNRGEIPFGFSNGMEVHFAYAGIGTFSGRPNPNLRLVGLMFPLRTGLVVPADWNIKSIRELSKFKGKRIASKYTSLSIIELYISGSLANGGLRYDDFERVPVSGFAKGVEALGEGKVEISWVSLGSGVGRKVNTQLRSRGGFRYLDLDTSPEAVKRYKDIMPGADIALITDTKMPGIHEPTHIVSLAYLMMTNKDTDAEVVYKVTKTLAENRPELIKSMGAFRASATKDMAPKHATPYHPAALKAFKELGVAVGM